jgi:hypothetical protein
MNSVVADSTHACNTTAALNFRLGNNSLAAVLCIVGGRKSKVRIPTILRKENIYMQQNLRCSTRQA